VSSTVAAVLEVLSLFRARVPHLTPLVLVERRWAVNDGVVHRFFAKLESANPLDRLRNFTLAFYPSDDTVAVFEPPVRNSGFKGGVHLQRRLVRLPSGAPMTAADVTIGESVVIHKHVFRVLDADKDTRERCVLGGGGSGGVVL
jgi:hypothetical protein